MKDNAPPLITVIVAAYNYLNSLQLCLLSLERQSFKDFEVIIADDGSKDDLVD
ncbi:MAG TPA: glycosyltransferase, partial [Thiotrichaceae bacterium]|nr:glycosyltransferase [Thiotrichaceae bacterium]